VSTKRPGRAELAGPLALCALFVGLAAWSWGTWPDPLVDFGRELYVPWRVSEGEVFGRDVVTLFGPVSPHLNALWFLVGGASLRTLVIANLALLAGLSALLYRLLTAACDRATAAVVTGAFLAVFAFGASVSEVGNYNFVTPYSHDLTHGLLLGVGCVALLWRHARTGGAGAAVLAGATLGLACLSKPEAGLAVLAAALAALGALSLARGPLGARPARAAACVALGAVGVLAAALLLLSLRLPVSAAARVAGGAWLNLGAARGSPFYEELVGADAPAHHALLGLRAFLVGALMVGGAAALDRATLGAPRAREPAALAVGIPLMGLTLLGLLPWPELPRALPLALGLFVVALGRRLRRAADREAALRAFLPLVGSVFALVLLAKMGLVPWWGHYGFALTAPATIVVFAAALHHLPAALARRHGGGDVARRIGLFVVACMVGGHVRLGGELLAARTLPIGRGADAFLARPDVGALTWRITQRLEALSAAGDSVVVLPEGAMINFLARRPAGVPWVTYMPIELKAFGDDRVLESLRARPPRWVVVLPRSGAEYGVARFGDPGWGQELLDWVQGRYDLVETVEGGATILRRR
jgi:hypothetical protein